MWIHWNKATNLFHAEEVSRILSFPAPRLNDLVRIDMKDYALCYQFPSSPTGFQNFAMWPLFTCLSIPNIVGVIEAAVSPTRRIIFVSHFPAILTIAAETVRFCVRVYEWSGLYVPVVHARHAKELVNEPGPYILGITAECRSLFTAPTDALVVDLDRNFVLTSSPPNILSPGQRTKMIDRLTQSLNGDITPSGVPQHLRAAYGGGKLIPAGRIIVERGEVESIQDPLWWNQDSVMTVMDHVCEKLVSVHIPFSHSSLLSSSAADTGQGRNTGVKAIFGGTVKKPLMTKVSMRHLNEIVRERNQYSRDALEAWQDFINLKGRMDTELHKVTKRNNFLETELETWKSQFLKFQAFAEQLNKEVSELRVKIESHKRENRRLTGLIDQQKDDQARISLRLKGTEIQRDQALEALVLQQGIAEDLERERARNKKEIAALHHTQQTISRQRDEAQRVVLHLRSLINGQTHHMEHIVRSLGNAPELSEYIKEGYEDVGEEQDHQEIEHRDGGLVDTLKTMAGFGESGQAPTSDSANGMTSEVEGQFLAASPRSSKRFSSLSMSDVADRHLRDRTDAIADIIRNISEQCAAAVEGLQLANEDLDLQETENRSTTTTAVEEDAIDKGGEDDLEGTDDGQNTNRSENDVVRDGHLTPNSNIHSSIPPTPELVDRSSTAMSMASSAPTAFTERTSQQYTVPDHTRIAEADEAAEKVHGRAGGSEAGEANPHQQISKQSQDQVMSRPLVSRAVN